MAITFGEWIKRNPVTIVGTQAFISQRGACDFRFIAETLGIRVENVTLGTGGVVNRTPIPIDLAALCTSDKINMWSLRKPVRHSKREPLTGDDYRSVNYGYNVTSVRYSNLDMVLSSDTYGWSYLRPMGGAASKYRATDFAGYSHTVSPVWTIEAGNDTPCIGENARMMINFGDIMEWSLFKTGSWKLAAYVPGVGVYGVTNIATPLQLDEVVNNGRFNMPITSGKFTAGTTYTVYPLLTTANITQVWQALSSSDTSNFYPIPCCATFTPRIKQTPLDNTSVQLIGSDNGFDYYEDSHGVPMIANVRATVRITVKARPTDYQSTYVYSTQVCVRAQNGTQSVDVKVFEGQLSFAMGQTDRTATININYPGPIELAVAPKEEDILPLTVRYDVNQYTASGAYIGSGSETVYIGT